MLSKALRLGLLALIVSGCAHNSTPLEPYDPLEDENRAVFRFNQKLDAYVLAPTAHAYAAVTPQFFRQGVDNFVSNALYPGTILNDVLQGKFQKTLKDSARFMVNTTIGLAGLFDPASAMGLEESEEDLGQTLAVWGVNSGPFLELPVLGPRYLRHTAEIPAGSFTNVLYHAFEASVSAPLMALYYINLRAMLDKAVRIRDEAALDPYLFTRSAYMQYREQLIYDGAPPRGDLYDESIFEELELEEESVEPEIGAEAP